MRAAPPAFELTLPGGRRERAVVAVLYGLAALVFTSWLNARLALTTTGWSAGLLAALPAMAAALLGWWVMRPARGQLVWNGASWAWRSLVGTASAPLELRNVQRVWDAGPWLYLRLQPAHGLGSLWCGVSAREAGPAWHALRLAIYHRARWAPTQPAAGA